MQNDSVRDPEWPVDDEEDDQDTEVEDYLNDMIETDEEICLKCFVSKNCPSLLKEQWVYSVGNEANLIYWLWRRA